MDIATYIILSAFLISIAVAVVTRSLTSQLITISAIWLSTTISGEFVFTWAGNSTCSTYLGCVDGFMGYDAFEHFFAGIGAALLILWLCHRYPRYSILRQERWKAIVTLVAAVALIAVVWEIIECAHDAIRLDIFHESLRNVRIHLNLLDQPSNIDTMGDLTFNVIGSIVGGLLQWKKFSEKQQPKTLF